MKLLSYPNDKVPPLVGFLWRHRYQHHQQQQQQQQAHQQHHRQLHHSERTKYLFCYCIHIMKCRPHYYKLAQWSRLIINAYITMLCMYVVGGV